jgi:hypothetical protein
MRRARAPWRTWLGIAAGLAAFTATAALALTRTGEPGTALPLAALAAAGPLLPAPASGPPGPEGVPIPKALSLAPPRPLRVGEQIAGIRCQSGEQVAYHIHAHLTIVVRGHLRKVPGGVGIAAPYEVASTPAGRFVPGASCFMWLHTHAADGLVHIESPVKRTYTLGDFFDIWGQPLSRHRVGRAQGHVTALLNGHVFTGNPRQIPLLAHAQIELEVDHPIVAPDEIAFPRGL